ncbi:phosphopantothenoylcysteine decarboxylase [Anaerostipes sp. 494a]|uniref:bifunctional phosphopantothenoylcysteine decarboxylase/phosphopantothenate--cysteine ligase CoaBC n=1 Tax=Anaerostipes sp. 494a TaxID=1261636 RepID=UPI0009532F8A|nr:bifunctional phosphopantothenoylcysteine decarboxylase/phosphopantothenate--cysteine ligase CoaBC [Anaerostipes sp. 494a]OLR59887.1 phosphopantothenoylcysteine decarboxylase [Anaerostipes sp. 494a]
MLKGKTVVLGVTGSVAAYKMANVASMLVKRGCEVHVIMTKNATNFINPIAFESLTNTKCLVETFDRNFQFHVAHVSLTDKADVMLIAPASANIIGKIAGGIADDMLSTTVMACKKPVIIAPAMNTKMYENPILQDNLDKLRRFGYEIIEPDSGHLACGTTGAGKMPSEEVLVAHIERQIAMKKDMKGKKVLVTAGPTIEAIDPVRFISNHSSGKMGYAIAKAAMLRGAEVTLVTGKTSLEPPMFVDVVPVNSASDMYKAVTEKKDQQDIIIKAAAVADYTPAEVSDEKVKKKDADMSISLVRTKDILGTLGVQRKKGQFLCGFSMETQNMLENSRAKLQKKNIDMIVANNLKEEGAGFKTDTNVVTFITRNEEKQLPKLTKNQVADELLDYILKQMEA